MLTKNILYTSSRRIVSVPQGNTNLVTNNHRRKKLTISPDTLIIDLFILGGIFFLSLALSVINANFLVTVCCRKYIFLI